MDLVQDWAANLLGADHSAYTPYLYQAYRMSMTAKSYLTQLIEQASRKPDLATIVLLLIIAFVSLKILNMLAQTVLFWLRMLRSVAFYGALGALGLWMYTRGPEGVVADVQGWWDIWNSEYGYWKERDRAAAMAGRQRGGGAAYKQAGWF